MRACVEAVAAAAPDWLPTVIDIADWGRRYGARVNTWRLPTSKTKRAELVAAYGIDAVTLLRAVYDAGAAHWLRELPAVDVLRRVLLQNYVITTDAAGREVIRAREADTDRPRRRVDVPDSILVVDDPNAEAAPIAGARTEVAAVPYDVPPIAAPACRRGADRAPGRIGRDPRRRRHPPAGRAAPVLPRCVQRRRTTRQCPAHGRRTGSPSPT